MCVSERESGQCISTHSCHLGEKMLVSMCVACDQSDRRMTHHQEMTGSGHLYREMMTSLPPER